MAARLSSALNSIKVKDRGVFVQASTLGSLEALLEFLKVSKIPVSDFNLFHFEELCFKKDQQTAPSIYSGSIRFFKYEKSWIRHFFRNENKAHFVLMNHFTFANRKICAETIKTKVLLCTLVNGFTNW